MLKEIRQFLCMHRRTEYIDTIHDKGKRFRSERCLKCKKIIRIPMPATYVDWQGSKNVSKPRTPDGRSRIRSDRSRYTYVYNYNRGTKPGNKRKYAHGHYNNKRRYTGRKNGRYW